jgi:hypothetical protein
MDTKTTTFNGRIKNIIFSKILIMKIQQSHLIIYYYFLLIIIYDL